jgi:hypothetical protein
VADVKHPFIGVDFLSHSGLLLDCKHSRLIGRHSRFLPVSRGARTTSTVSLRTTSKGRDPHQTGERHLPCTQDHLPRLQSVRRGFPNSGRTNYSSTGLPTYQNSQSALPFPGHSELLQAISRPHGGTSDTTSRRASRPQSHGISPHHLTPERLKAFEECKANLLRATLLAHLDPSAPVALLTDASTSALDAVLQQRVKNCWKPLIFFPKKLKSKGKPTAGPPPPPTPQST